MNMITYDDDGDLNYHHGRRRSSSMKKNKMSLLYSLVVCLTFIASSPLVVVAAEASLKATALKRIPTDSGKDGVVTKNASSKNLKGSKKAEGVKQQMKDGIDKVKGLPQKHGVLTKKGSNKNLIGSKKAKEVEKQMKYGIDNGKGSNNVEKFKELQKKQRQKINKEKISTKKGGGGWLKKNKKKNKNKDGIDISAIDKETGETKVMKQFRKGTPEFDERINTIDKKKKERKKEHDIIEKKAGKIVNRIFKGNKGKLNKGEEKKNKEPGAPGKQQHLSSSNKALQKYGTPLEKESFGVLKKPSIVGLSAAESSKKSPIVGLSAAGASQKPPIVGLSAAGAVSSTGNNPRNVQYKKKLQKPGRLREKLENMPFIGKRLYELNDEEELILDASLAFIHSLKFGTIFDTEKKIAPISKEKKDTLHKWLQLLSVSLPPEWSIHTLIYNLIENIDIISASEEQLNYVLNQYNFPRKRFSKSCGVKRGRKLFSIPFKRDKISDYEDGFSCGFWKLLHLVTIGIAEHRGGITLTENGIIDTSNYGITMNGGGAVGTSAKTTTSTYPIFSPLQAADTIRDFIHHFYSCEVCKEKFMKLYDNCDNQLRCVRLNDNVDTDVDTAIDDTYTDDTYTDDDLPSILSTITESSSNPTTTKDWQELAKWMWEFHNEFNVILMHEHNHAIQEDYFLTSGSDVAIPVKEEYVQAIWPSMTNCFLCFHDDGEWNYDAIFLFLEKTYWLGSVFDEQTDKLLKFDFEDEFYYYSSEEGSIILNMWIVAIIMVIVLYYVISTNSSSQVALRLKQYQLKAKILQQNVMQETAALAASVGGTISTRSTKGFGKRSD